MKAERKNLSAPVVIGDNVWIGSGAVILLGVTLRSGCIVGAGEVMTRDVPAWAVVTGCQRRWLKNSQRRVVKDRQRWKF